MNSPFTTNETLPATSPGRSGRRRFPAWLRKRLPPAGSSSRVTGSIACKNLHTVCVEAKCPNRAECFSCGTATFLILGTVCARNCGFCGVEHGTPLPIDENEPENVAHSARTLDLRHIVITSVTRDDLPDGGAGHFVRTMEACRSLNPESTIEILVPDFNGSARAIDTVLSGRPDLFNHNIETAARLYPAVRPQGVYSRSLALLAAAAHRGLTVKSGLMVGLGETETDVLEALKDLRRAGCSIVTIGQYLQPSAAQLPVETYVPPDQFSRYREAGKRLGFTAVESGPFVRSSYHAREVFEENRNAVAQRTGDGEKRNPPV